MKAAIFSWEFPYDADRVKRGLQVVDGTFKRTELVALSCFVDNRLKSRRVIIQTSFDADVASAPLALLKLRTMFNEIDYENIKQCCIANQDQLLNRCLSEGWNMQIDNADAEHVDTLFVEMPDPAAN